MLIGQQIKLVEHTVELRQIVQKSKQGAAQQDADYPATLEPMTRLSAQKSSTSAMRPDTQ